LFMKMIYRPFLSVESIHYTRLGQLNVIYDLRNVVKMNHF